MRKLFTKRDSYRRVNLMAETSARATQNVPINPLADQAVQELVQGNISAEKFIVLAVLAATQVDSR